MARLILTKIVFTAPHEVAKDTADCVLHVFVLLLCSVTDTLDLGYFL